MKTGRQWLIVMMLTLLVATAGFPQKSKTSKSTKKPATKTTVKTQTKNTTTPVEKKSQKEFSADEKKVQDIVAFYEYMLNSIGSNETPARDKEVLITQSYSKIFRDEKVQIEDDLDENRTTITNKDVIAYLKDVDFFFKDVKFEFHIDDIKTGTLAGGKIFYKVSLSRNLKGITPDGKTVNNTIPRFIEINYDADIQDLKIASVYTNEYNEKESLINWWNGLSYEWQSIFRRELNLPDSVTLDDLRNITSLQKLDLSNNPYIQNILPLSVMLDLRELDLRNTNISDLSPVRNLSELRSVNISNTKIQDLTALRYAISLEKLLINNTTISDIAVLERLQSLKALEMNKTPIHDFAFLSNLSGLTHLRAEETSIVDLPAIETLSELRTLSLAKTKITDLTALSNLKKISYLNIDSTNVEDISALRSVDSLRILHANNTGIQNLLPLQSLTKLEKIFCDQSKVTKDIADSFTKAKPNTLVIYDSKDLLSWWNNLSPHWQRIFRKTIGTHDAPDKEQLAILTHIDSLDISGNYSIQDLEPLQKLENLKKFKASGTSIQDLTPLKACTHLTSLDIHETSVSDITPLVFFSGLQTLIADKTKIENLEPLYDLQHLTKLYVDHTYVHDIIARDFLERQQNCLIIYKTIHLNRWWKNLTPDWKTAFAQMMKGDTTTTRENLHRLVEVETVTVQDVGVKDLSMLGEFVRIKSLSLSGTAVTDLSFVSQITTLKTLRCTNSPLQKTEALKNLTGLEDLDLSNTPVDDLKMIEELKNLKMLNLAGTQVKKIVALKHFEKLEFLDCSNTYVNSIEPLLSLPLKTFKCYNTKISSREIEMFKKHQPDCQVIYYR